MERTLRVIRARLVEMLAQAEQEAKLAEGAGHPEVAASVRLCAEALRKAANGELQKYGAGEVPGTAPSSETEDLEETETREDVIK